MIELRSPFKIEPDPRGGWQLILWAGDAFDYTTPFRDLLGDIAEALGKDRQNDLQLHRMRREKTSSKPRSALEAGHFGFIMNTPSAILRL
jgi:hypothetical protein